MKQAFIYSLKVWLTTVLVSPFLLFLTGILISHTPLNQDAANGLLWFVPAFALFGALLSSPLYLVFRVAIVSISKRLMTLKQMKFCLSGIVVLLCLMGFSAFILLLTILPPHKTDWTTLVMCVPYVLVAIAATWFYKLEIVKFNHCSTISDEV